MPKPEREMSEQHFLSLMLFNSVIAMLPEYVKKLLGQRIKEQADAMADIWLERGAPPDLVKKNTIELDDLSELLLDRDPVTSAQTTPAGNSRWN